MAWLTGSLSYIVPFLVVLTVLVFVHELGHYLVARRNRVRVETFSIGFGPELFGWNDRSGTRWKVSAIPLGGYVKMFGDADPASMPGDQLKSMSEAERAVSFHHKRLLQRAAIVSAGPIANFIFAILLLAVVFAVWGQPVTRPEIGKVEPGSPAAAAGIQSGDLVRAVNGHRIERFEDVLQPLQLNPKAPVTLLIDRKGKDFSVTLQPQVRQQTDRFGNQYEVGDVGIGPPFIPPLVGQVEPGSAADQAGLKAGDEITAIDGEPIAHFEDIQRIVRESPGKALALTVQRGREQVKLVATPRPKEDADHHTVGLLGIAQKPSTDFVRRDPFTAVVHAGRETWNVTVATLDAVGQMVMGSRSTGELSGVLGIGRMSGQAAQGGPAALIGFAALLSINLGLINLFPIPVLDGGHLLFYAAEAIRGKPLGQRAQEYGFRIGLALVLTLMIFATWNDLVRLKFVALIRGLIT